MRRGRAGYPELRKALPAGAEAEQFGAPKRTMTELFAVICHGMWKQLCLVNLMPVSTELTAARCWIYCCMSAFLFALCRTFLISFFYPPATLEGRKSETRKTLKAERQTGVLLDPSEQPLPPSDLWHTCFWCLGLAQRHWQASSCGRIEKFVYRRLKFASPNRETTKPVLLSLKPD